MKTPRTTAPPAVLALALLAACNDGGSLTVARPTLNCGDLDPSFLADGGVGRDGIPALTEPAFVELGHENAGYMSDGSRVIGVQVGGEWLAIPHNIMYRHEIVNVQRGEERVAVTYCPLTGSALAFDRASVGGAEFGVSGLLYQANLIMYDRSTDDSLWPQMAGAAGCGPRAGQALVRRPVLEMRWGSWRQRFQASKVVGVEGFDQGRYRVNPYGSSYENPDNADYLGFPIPREDVRRQPKERVLGLPAAGGRGPLAFPFHAMEAKGDAWVAEFEHAGEPAAVLWDRPAFAAIAVRPVTADGRRLTFRMEDGAVVDNETGSTWSVSGAAVRGPLEGERLPLIADAYVAFWLAWAAFHPNTELFVE